MSLGLSAFFQDGTQSYLIIGLADIMGEDV